MSNQVLDTIKSRSSIRAYTPEKLTEDQIAALKEAALASPTAMNKQSQRYYFITSPELKQTIEQATVQAFAQNSTISKHLASRNNKVLYDAPLFIVIAVEEQNAYGKVDAGIAVQNLALAAKSLGLDSVILGLPAAAFAQQTIKEQTGFAAGYEYGVGIAIGYKAEGKEPHKVNFDHIIEIK